MPKRTIPELDIVRKLLTDRPVAYHPFIAKSVGGIKPGLFLCQLLFWSDKGDDPNGWIYKSQSEIEEETGMTRYEQESARQTLTSKSVLEEEKRGLPRRLYYRLNWEVLIRLFSDEAQRASVQQTNIQACSKPTYNNVVCAHASYTENTTETTTEIPDPPLPPPTHTTPDRLPAGRATAPTEDGGKEGSTSFHPEPEPEEDPFQDWEEKSNSDRQDWVPPAEPPTPTEPLPARHSPSYEHRREARTDPAPPVPAAPPSRGSDGSARSGPGPVRHSAPANSVTDRCTWEGFRALSQDEQNIIRYLRLHGLTVRRNGHEEPNPVGEASSTALREAIRALRDAEPSPRDKASYFLGCLGNSMAGEALGRAVEAAIPRRRFRQDRDYLVAPVFEVQNLSAEELAETGAYQGPCTWCGQPVWCLPDREREIRDERGQMTRNALIPVCSPCYREDGRNFDAARERL